MKFRYIHLIIILLLSIAISSNANNQSITVTKNLTSMPLAFTENQGQWDDEVLYRANAGGATMWFTKDGAVYQFTRNIPKDDAGIDDPMDPMSHLRDHQPDSIESIAIKASFVGSNPNSRMVGHEKMEYKCNYFIGNDPNEWHTDVPNYKTIIYEEIYDGIDLKYYGNGTHMEYDFIVSPGADFSQIKIQYEGAESILVNANGELIVETIWGEVVEQRPVVYQVENDRRIPVEGIYSLQGDNSFGFELSGYNPVLPLVIDPVLSYSTYLGGSGDDVAWGIVVDTSGVTYITGYTTSTDFPTQNPYQSVFGGIYSDVFITKLSNDGNSLIYSTYLGGNDEDFGFCIAIDTSRGVYVTGYTTSTDFPTQNPYQSAYGGGTHDVFIAKLNSDGNSLVYSTYLGGNISDGGYGIAVDVSGVAYVTGFTCSADFPTQTPYQITSGGDYDGFVTKLSNDGNSLIYSTYIGGSDNDYGFDIAIDALGAAYITGKSYSTDFPTENPLQPDQDTTDIFVTKFSSGGNSLVYSTYLGGSDEDDSYGIAIDSHKEVYVTGWTASSDFPTLNPYQFSNSGYADVFITKIREVNDNDGDGIADEDDNCPYDYNPSTALRTGKKKIYNKKSKAEKAYDI